MCFPRVTKQCRDLTRTFKRFLVCVVIEGPLLTLGATIVLLRPGGSAQTSWRMPPEGAVTVPASTPENVPEALDEGAEPVTDNTAEQRIYDLANAVVRALTSGNGRSNQCVEASCAPGWSPMG
jgi:hypothetical protein